MSEAIAEGSEHLERALRFLASGDTLRAERDDVGWLAAGEAARAARRERDVERGQERANAIAAERGITVQTAPAVIRDESAGPFGKRLRLADEAKHVLGLHGHARARLPELMVPFAGVGRRGPRAGAKGPRTLAAAFAARAAHPPPPAHGAP